MLHSLLSYSELYTCIHIYTHTKGAVAYLPGMVPFLSTVARSSTNYSTTPMLSTVADHLAYQSKEQGADLYMSVATTNALDGDEHRDYLSINMY